MISVALTLTPRLIEGDPLANDDLDGQLERLIVRAYNRDGQSADLIVHIRAVRGHDGQSSECLRLTRIYSCCCRGKYYP